MRELKKRALCLLMLTLGLGIAGCMSPPTIQPAGAWKLPPRESADSAMIIGRIGPKAPGNEQILRYVTVQRWGKMYPVPGHTPKGEEHFIMDNNYFVVPNLKPEKYFFAGINVNGDYNAMPSRTEDLINLKAGQVKFLGSFDYKEGSLNTLLTIAQLPKSASLTPAAGPSEVEMLRWLLRAGTGSGWEPTIKQRLRELGAKP